MVDDGSHGNSSYAMEMSERKMNPVDEPVAPDEGWWAAVLSDEPQMDLSGNIDPVFTSKSQESTPRNAIFSVNWQKIQKIYSEDEIVTMQVVGLNRGGVLVADEDLHGFVPASHLIDVPADCPNSEREKHLIRYLNCQVSLKVIECDPEKERVVFSERAAQAEEGQRKHLLCHLKQGDTVKGVVTNVTSFGAFMDLGGIEGLIHVSELSWGRVQNPSEIIRVGDEVDAVVLQVDEERGRIGLSLKQLEDNPWDFISAELTSGDIIKAKISSIVKYGAFARLEQGIEGLIHISSMNFLKGSAHIEDFLYEGQDVKVYVLSVDPFKRRIGLKLEGF